MALHDFGDMHQAFHHLLVHGAALERDTHIGAGAVAQRLGVHLKSRTGDYSVFYQMLNTLMNGCARDSALGSYVFERNSGIFR